MIKFLWLPRRVSTVYGKRVVRWLVWAIKDDYGNWQEHALSALSTFLDSGKIKGVRLLWRVIKGGVHAYDFPHPAVSVAVCVLSPDKSEVLVVRRANEPFNGILGLPAGYLGVRETSRSAAMRILAEKTGIDATQLTGVSSEAFLMDAPERDPRERTIQIVYSAVAPPNQGEWLPISKLDSEKLAFDDAEVIKECVRLQ